MNEPVAYINVEKRALEWAKLTRWETPTTVKMDKVPLYTAPPQQNEFNPDWDAMAVMVEEQQRMAKRIEELTQLVTSQGIRLMDAEAQPEPEPVAYRYWNEHNKCYFFCEHQESDGSVYEPIFSTPPQKEWVGLTEQEQSDIAWEKDKSRIWIVTATEAKLKEKNGG
jgi:hypothetical protein